MSLYNSFDRNKHFSELNDPIFTNVANGQSITPEERKEEARANLGLSGDVAGVGTASTDDAVTTEEYSDGLIHRTVITLNDFEFGSTDDSTALASGGLIYTLPAGDVVVRSVVFAVGLGLTDSATPTTDTPDCGIGTTIASGAVSVLGGTAGFENILTGQTMNDMAGTVEFVTASPGLAIASASAHTIYLNVADTWADYTPNDPGVTASGTIIIEWVSV